MSVMKDYKHLAYQKPEKPEKPKLWEIGLSAAFAAVAFWVIIAGAFCL